MFLELLDNSGTEAQLADMGHARLTQTFLVYAGIRKTEALYASAEIPDRQDYFDGTDSRRPAGMLPSAIPA